MREDETLKASAGGGVDVMRERPPPLKTLIFSMLHFGAFSYAMDQGSALCPCINIDGA